MNKIISLLLLLFVALPCISQESLFKNAIKNGRQQKHFYEIYNNKSKYIKLDELKEICRSNNYIIGNYSIKEIGRFGDVAESVERFLFIPQNEYGAYIFENLSSTTPFSMLTSQGSAYIYEKSSYSFFKRYDNVQWTGTIKNGMLEGMGEGFKQLSNNSYIYFIGTFIDGIPSGQMRYCIYNIDQAKYVFSTDMKHEFIENTGKLSEGLCWFQSDGKYGFINQYGKTVIKPIFLYAKDFYNGIAYVKDGSTEVKINKKGEVIAVSENAEMSFIDMVTMKNKYPHLAQSIEVLANKYIEGNLGFIQLNEVEKEFPNLRNKILSIKTVLYRKDISLIEKFYEEAIANMNGLCYGDKETKDFLNIYYNFDPDGKMKLVRELDEYNDVCNAASLSVNMYEKFWQKNNGKPSFNNDCYTALKCLSYGLSICSRSSKTAFSRYYAKVKTNIHNNYNILDNKIENDKKEYQKAIAEYENQQKQKDKILNNINSNNIYRYVVREKDWSRGRVLDSDDDFEDSREVIFKDLEGFTFSGIIYEKYNRDANIHYYSIPTGFFSNSYYKTYIDCLIAAFLHHYNRSWNVNVY